MPIRQTSFDFDNTSEENSVVKHQDAKTDVLAGETKPVIPSPVQPKEQMIYNNENIKKSTRGRMKLSDMNASAIQVQVPEDEELFKKSYYSIGTVSEMFKVNASLIRFWENEFTILKPKKNAKGDRFFRPEDVKNLKLIYHLLRERKYTIEGAKEFLKNNKKAVEKFAIIESLQKIRSFLVELKSNL